MCAIVVIVLPGATNNLKAQFKRSTTVMILRKDYTGKVKAVHDTDSAKMTETYVARTNTAET